jgi:hypothetical protein
MRVAAALMHCTLATSVSVQRETVDFRRIGV